MVFVYLVDFAVALPANSLGPWWKLNLNAWMVVLEKWCVGL